MEFYSARHSLTSVRKQAFCLEGEAMSDESEVDKVLSRATELRKSLGRVWTVVVLLFALWTLRKRTGLMGILTRLALLVAGVGTYGYWNGFFS